MKEELQIKVKVDTSNITTTLNKLKNEVSNVEQGFNKTATASSTTTKNTQANVQATSKLSKAIEGIKNSLGKIKSMDVFDFAGITASFATAEASVKGISKHIERMKKNANANLMGAVQGVIDGMGDRYGSDEGMNESELATMLKIQDIEKQLRSGDLGLKDLKKVRQEMKALGISTKGTTLGFKGFMAAAGSVAIAVGTVVAALVALAGVLVIIKGIMAAFSVSKLGDEIYHNASRFNMGTEAFQEWSYIMEHAGGTIDDLTGFMETLASEQAAVIEGSEDAAANFKRLGLSMEEVSGMRQQELFEETVRRIQQIGDATERSAIAYSIFGDEASKFMNVLNMSNQEIDKVIENYHLLGGAMSGELLDKSNSLQGSIHNMKQAWQGISNTLAQAFIPIVQAVVRWLTKAFVVINLFLKSIFQIDLKQTGEGAMDGATSSTNKYTAATKSATKAAEQLKRVTMGFDELNIVSNPKSGSADSGSGAGGFDTGGLGGGLDTSFLDAGTLNLEPIYAWFEKYKTIIKDVTAWSLTLIGIIGGILAICFGQIPLGIALLAMGGIGILAGLGEGGTWDKFFTGIANFCKNVFSTVSQWLGNIVAKLGEFGKWIYDSFIQPIVDFFKQCWDGIVAIFTPAINWFSELFTSVYNSIKSIIDVIVGLFKGGWLLITTVWGIAKQWFNETVIQPVAGFFSSMWNSIKGAASKAWEGIKSAFSPVVNWFKDVFTKAWNGVKAVFSVGGKIFDGIKDGIANVFKTVVNGIIGGINKVIAVPFNAINGLLNKIRNVSVAGIEPFKGFIKYNALSVPQIPKLATGGIATRSTIAEIGEAGKEAILPLENNTEWMDTLATKIAERNQGPSKIVLQVGEKELGWAAINGINGITKQTGNIQLAL